MNRYKIHNFKREPFKYPDIKLGQSYSHETKGNFTIVEKIETQDGWDKGKIFYRTTTNTKLSEIFIQRHCELMS